jgi:hypothetical protein
VLRIFTMRITSPRPAIAACHAVAAIVDYLAAKTDYDEAEIALLPDWLDGSPESSARIARVIGRAIRREVAAEKRVVRALRAITGCESDLPCSLVLHDGRIVVALPDSLSPVTEDSLYGRLRGRILVIEADHTAQQ